MASSVATEASYAYDGAGRLTEVIYANGTTISYAYDANGNRTYSQTSVGAVPSKPTGLSAMAAPNGASVTLSWSASSAGTGGVAGYRIYRGGALLVSTTGGATTYVDGTVAGTTTYRYAVAAYDGSGRDSMRSNVATVTTPIRDTTAPATPTNLSAVRASATQVNLSWSGVSDNSGGSGLAGYRIFRGGTLLTSTSNSSYSDSGITSNQAYSVSAYDVVGNESSRSTTATPVDNIAPSTPTNVTLALSTAPNGQLQFLLSWSASTETGGSQLAGYRIYRTAVAGVYVTTTGTSYLDTDLVIERSYTYSVAAYDTSGNESPRSVEVTGHTGSPPVTGVVANAASSTQINLSWNFYNCAPRDTFQYRVRRNGVVIANPSATSYSDPGLAANTTYSYTIAAVCYAPRSGEFWDMPQSAPLAATTLADTIPPTTPGNLRASRISGSQVNLSWNASTDNGGSGLSGYRIYRSGALLTTTSATTFSDLSATATYSYTVTAIDGAGNQSPSSNTAVPGEYIQITNDNGDVLAASAALYASGVSCGPRDCTWRLTRRYGPLDEVFTVRAGGLGAPCPTGTTWVTTPGYIRPSTASCRIDAAFSVYGQ